ncbi:MAG: hypothetical protein Q7J16_09285 [Candidatus Cloacimonadales bacterium]|nr:hypothetical protein [Candidatus Cloacimonadales bacterium]
MNWLIMWPIVLFITLVIFVFITKEPLWKKVGAIVLPIIILIFKYLTTNYSIKVICQFALIIYFIILLIYYRNRGVI